MNKASPFLAAFARCLSCSSVRWIDGQPEARQRVYFANRISRLDEFVLWSSLPRKIRAATLPVAARDRWDLNRVGQCLAESCNLLLIDRHSIKIHRSPIDLLLSEMSDKHSLILFPEGFRHSGKEIAEFQSGLYYLSKKRPDLELVPVFLNRRKHVMSTPLFCGITIGSSMRLEAGEAKEAFLERAREAVCRLKNA